MATTTPVTIAASPGATNVAFTNFTTTDTSVFGTDSSTSWAPPTAPSNTSGDTVIAIQKQGWFTIRVELGWADSNVPCQTSLTLFSSSEGEPQDLVQTVSPWSDKTVEVIGMRFVAADFVGSDYFSAQLTIANLDTVSHVLNFSTVGIGWTSSNQEFTTNVY